MRTTSRPHLLDEVITHRTARRDVEHLEMPNTVQINRGEVVRT